MFPFSITNFRLEELELDGLLHEILRFALLYVYILPNSNSYSIVSDRILFSKSRNRKEKIQYIL